MKEYALGFAFDYFGNVVLIKKEKPEWMKGLWNGVGGKVEPGETSQQAMSREFHEETGMGTYPHDWEKFATLGDNESYTFDCFYAGLGVIEVETKTDEVVDVFSMYYLRNMYDGIGSIKLMPNLPWLLEHAWMNLLHKTHNYQTTTLILEV